MKIRSRSKSRETQGASKASENSQRESIDKKKSYRRRKNNRPRTARQLVLLACDQNVLEQLDQLGRKPGQVEIGKETFENAYPVSQKEARVWCRRYRDELRTCDSKFSAPFLLAFAWTTRSGQRVRATLLQRHELPISIQSRVAA